MRRGARPRAHGAESPVSIEQAFLPIIGSAMVGSIFTGLAAYYDFMVYVGDISYRFGGFGAMLVMVFVGQGVRELFALVKNHFLFYLRQWGAV